jgi:hypothetical protein
MTWPFKRAPEPCDDLIKPPVYRYTGSDESLRDRTKARREAAQRIRGRAAQVESGGAVSELLRRIK